MRLLISMTGVFVSLSLLAAVAASANPIGPVYPTPGGPGAWSSDGGDKGRSGGETWTYSVFDFNAVGQVWWGPTDNAWAPGPAVASAMDGAIDSPAETMTYNLATGHWEGSTTIYLDPTGNQAVDTRMRITVSQGGSAYVDSSTVGIGMETPIVSEITGDPFVLNLIFEARFAGTGSWIPFLDFYDGQPTVGANLTRMSFQEKFWYTALPVPGLGSVAIILLGILLGATACWRLRTSSLSA